MSSTKILFISHEGTRTGAPMFLLHFLRWLQRETKQEFEVLFDRGGPLVEEFAKVATVHTRQTLAAQPRLLESFDLIYANTCCNGLFIEGLPYGDLPILTHVHELDFGYDCLGARNMASVVKHSNRFVACAEIVARRFGHRFSQPRDRFSVHYEMIDPTRLAAPADAARVAELRRQHDLPEDAFIVAGCGSVDMRKGADLFIQLGARLQRELGTERPLRFLWIGRRNVGEFDTGLTHDLRRLGMQQQIKFVGEMAAPHELLALSNVFCLTSREDPFPLVMLEAAALGKPLVCFEGSGGAGEFCALGGGIAVPFLDVPAMAATCRDLLRDPASCAERGRQARDLVHQRFAVDAVAPGLWEEVRAFMQAALDGPQQDTRPGSFAEIYSTWPIDEAPQQPYIVAHLARHRARIEARALAQSGKRKEAAQVLIRAASSDIATKDPNIMVESLVLLGDDLAPIEPKQASFLRAEAEKLSRATGLPLNLFRERLAS